MKGITPNGIPSGVVVVALACFFLPLPVSGAVLSAVAASYK